MAEFSQQTVAAKKGLTTTHIILIVGFVVVIATVVGLFLYMNRDKEELQNAAVGVIDEANVTDLASDVNDKLAKSSFQTHMTNEWYFSSGTAPSSTAVVGNSVHNNYPFYITVVLEDTGEQIYKSGLIPVGKSLKEVVLEKNLPKGNYEAVCKYQLVDDQNNNEEIESSLGFKIHITIES